MAFYVSIRDLHSGPHADAASGISHWAISPASIQLFYIVVQNILIYRVCAQVPYNKVTEENATKAISEYFTFMS